ncbi:uncharacterized protein [Ranitomeya imitator]|uniref:uncharacterized protein isoform X2 n=1 Tax=Ranitomeya imitator TaxID=111125 RepID=UPI0037E9C21D
MDYKAREQSWLARINEMFSDSSKASVVDGGRDAHEAIKKLKDLLHRRTHIWWNRAFLIKYIETGLTPRGLRVQVFPSFEVEDVVFRHNWEELATTCSKGFMELLAQSNKESIDSLDREIETVQGILKQDLSEVELQTLNGEIDKEFQKWEKDICATKTAKFQRDVGDRQSNTVYRWNRKSRRHIKGLRRRSTSASMTSQASSEESSRSLLKASESHKMFPNREAQVVKRKVGYTNKQDKKYTTNQLQVINLSEYTLTQAQLEVLSKGLTFSPTNNFDFFTAIKDLFLFARKLILKKLHSKGNGGPEVQAEMEALKALEELLIEQESTAAVIR